MTGPLIVALVVVAVVVLGAVAVAQVRRQRRSDRQWQAQSTASLVARVDVARLTVVRREQGEIVAIKVLRDHLPGCPLNRSRDLVAELTGMPSGTR